VIKKEAAKILKCEDLVIEIQRMWNVKAKTLPVITGTILKSLRQNLSSVLGKHEIRDYKKKNSRIGHCTYTAGSTDVK